MAFFNLLFLNLELRLHQDAYADTGRAYIVSRSHTLSKTGEGLVCLASSTCALLPKSGKSNQIAGKPILTFRPYVTSRIRPVSRTYLSPVLSFPLSLTAHA